MITLRYFREIFRVTAPGSFVVFDLITEKCITRPLIDAWIESGMNHPTFLSKMYVVNLFRENSFSLVGSFTSKYSPAISEFLVFRKDNE